MSLDFNIIKLSFGALVLVGFFFVVTLMIVYPEAKTEALLILVGQLSAGFILVLRHVFQSKTEKKI